MASAIDISNLALAHLGDEANIASFTEGSAQAEHCRRYYPMARDALIEKHTWSFATRRVALALLDVTPPASWVYVYECPSTATRVVSVLLPTALDDSESEDFVQESLEDGTKVIYTNAPLATVRYVALVTDTTKFSPLFVLALARLMASMLAGPIIKGETGTKVADSHLNHFMKNEYPDAVASDARASQNEPYRNHVPAGISARR